MVFPILVSTRLLRSAGRGASSVFPTSFLLSLGLTGVALSLSIMLIAVAIILGFRNQIHDYTYSQTGHISVYPSESNWATSSKHFKLTTAFADSLKDNPAIATYCPLLQRMALIKTKDDYEGVMLFAVDSGFDHHYFSRHVVEGSLSALSSDTDNPIVLSDKQARTLGVHIGDRLHLYFFDPKVRIRTYQLVATYDASGLDKVPALCSAKSIRTMDRLEDNVYNRLMIQLTSSEHTDAVASGLQTMLQGRAYTLSDTNLQVSTAKSLAPELFNWLDLLDSNVYLLLSLMVLVGGFTMITGVIVIVLDKVRQIGILKSLGATDWQIRKVFLLIACQLMGLALLLGNVIAGAFCLLQSEFRLITLDPRNYFMDTVPISFDLFSWLGVNVLAGIIIILMLLLPTTIISRISPASVMRFD